MSKGFKYLMITMVLLLAGCRSSLPTTSPSDTVLPEATAAAPSAPTTVAAPPPSETPPPAPTETAIPEPPTLTPDLEDLTSGPVIPLLTASHELTLQEIHMVTSQAGWGISEVDPYGDHILVTSSGGRAWQDVTPPQPVNGSGPSLSAAFGYADENTAFVNYSGSNLVWTTYNGGTTWQPYALPNSSMWGGMISVLDSEHAWLFQFLDGGMQKVYTAIARTANGGQTWETILDPYSEANIQGFDKTGADFLNPQFGVLTRDFRGVAVYVYLDLTQDGGVTWDQLEMPAPPSDPDAFSTCACGLYDPQLQSPQRASVRLTCQCFEGDTQLTKNYLYKTEDQGQNWTIYYVPEGDLHTISDQVRYLTAAEIYRSTDGGKEWDRVKTVNWEGQFSFVNSELAWAIAYDPEGGRYALVKTTDGCVNFQILEPVMEPSKSVR